MITGVEYIALLEVVGKVVARVLQDRLQQIAEDELHETQCGFCKGRGCTDMIWCPLFVN